MKFKFILPAVAAIGLSVPVQGTVLPCPTTALQSPDEDDEDEETDEDEEEVDLEEVEVDQEDDEEEPEVDPDEVVDWLASGLQILAGQPRPAPRRAPRGAGTTSSVKTIRPCSSFAGTVSVVVDGMTYTRGDLLLTFHPDSRFQLTLYPRRGYGLDADQEDGTYRVVTHDGAKTLRLYIYGNLAYEFTIHDDGYKLHSDDAPQYGNYGFINLQYVY